MKPPIRVRGAVMAEAAVMLSFILLVMYGAVDVAIAGYWQEMFDGGTFLAAHEYALGVVDPNAIATPFPGLFNASTTTVVNPAPPENVQEPVDYNYSDSDGRHGGAQMIRPQHLQYSVSRQLGLLGQTVTVAGGAVEARNLMSDRDFNVSGFDPNSASTTNSMIDPFTQDDQNAPPYYVGSHYMQYCADNENESVFGTSCNSGNTFRALGVAEFLDNDNWNNAGNGIDSGGVYQLAACHQRYFAKLAVAFPDAAGAMPWFQKSGVPYPNPNSDPYNVTSNLSGPGWGNASFTTIYSWDVPVSAFKGGGPGNNPLHPGLGC